MFGRKCGRSRALFSEAGVGVVGRLVHRGVLDSAERWYKSDLLPFYDHICAGFIAAQASFLAFCRLLRLMIICGSMICCSEQTRSLNFLVCSSLPEAVYHRYSQQKVEEQTLCIVNHFSCCTAFPQCSVETHWISTPVKLLALYCLPLSCFPLIKNGSLTTCCCLVTYRLRRFSPGDAKTISFRAPISNHT